MANMNRSERVEQVELALMAALEGFQADLWTCMPAIVESFDPETNTVSARPSVMGRVRSADKNAPIAGAIFDKENWWWVPMPVMQKVPVQFPGGGGFVMTFPIKQGDDILVVFANRCIDLYWRDGGCQKQFPELRMHSLSDGYAIPRTYPLPKVPAGISPDNVQLRSEDGEVYLEMTPDQVININSPTVNIGNLDTVKRLVNELFFNWAQSHTHSGVTAGSGVTGPPVVQPDDATMMTNETKAS